VADAATGTVRLIALGWVATIDAGKDGPELCLAVPDGAGGLVRVAVRGDLGELTRQLDGQADVSGLATLDDFVATSVTSTITEPMLAPAPEPTP
jgi:hypothetical protein